MSRTFAYVLSSFFALGLLAAPAAAQDMEYPPPPPPDDQQDPGQPPPEVDYGRPVEPQQPPPPPSTVQQCAPCEQRQSPPAVAHQGLLLLGYVGANMFVGKGILDDSAAAVSLSVGPGLRLGGLVGGHVTPWISVNGELTVDFMNTDDPYGYWVTGGRRFVLSLSPLVHLAANSSGSVEAVIGPKLGMRFLSMTSHSSETFSARGYMVGLNGGVFVRAGGTVMLGGLVSFELSRTSTACRDQNFSGGSGECGADTTGVPFERVAALAGSILF
jgi:hypothetical protein